MFVVKRLRFYQHLYRFCVKKVSFLGKTTATPWNPLLGVLLTLARQPDPDPSMKTHVRNIRQRSPNRYRCEWQLLLYRLHGLRPTRHRVAAAAENPLPGTRPLAIHVPRKFHNPFPNPHSD